MNIFQKIVAYLRLREAVNRADKAHVETGDRYYVMPGNGKIRLVIVDRKNFRRLRMKSYIPAKARINDLIAECFYFTPYRNGNGWITEEFRRKKIVQYFSWCEAVRKNENKIQKKLQKNGKIK